MDVDRFRAGAPYLLPIGVAVLAIGIFVIDTLTDLELAAAVLYVAVVLMASSFCRMQGVILVAAGCMLLTLLSYILTSGGSPQTGIVNGLISLLMIAMIAYLALKIGSAQVAALEARAQLSHVARLTALGELTASIAHEINQPLAAIVTSGNACARWLSANPPNVANGKSAVDRIVKDANRASEIISRIRALAKRTEPKKERLDINDVVAAVVSLVRRELTQGRITIKVRLADDLDSVFGDGIQLQQVLLNLIMNAIESLNAVSEGPRELLVTSSRDGSNGVRVAVEDTGSGLDAKDIDRVFAPFFTTKPEGMGMGLAISHSIVEAHRGRIWSAPRSPRGAIFQFSLPARGSSS